MVKLVKVLVHLKDLFFEIGNRESFHTSSGFEECVTIPQSMHERPNETGLTEVSWINDDVRPWLLQIGRGYFIELLIEERISIMEGCSHVNLIYFYKWQTKKYKL